MYANMVRIISKVHRKTRNLVSIEHTINSEEIEMRCEMEQTGIEIQLFIGITQPGSDTS